jgi:hypothetical protein
MILGLIIGFGVGLNVGLWYGILVTKRIYKDLIEDYKKSVDYWYKEYMEMLKQYKEMQILYVKEAVKNIGK